MKIVLIHGQNHKGSTYHIGRQLAERLGDKDEIIEFFLPKDLNHFCVGCYRCIEDQSQCPFWAEKEPMLRAMEDAELLILTSPNYCLGPSASLKAFFDMMFDCWMVHRPLEWMFQKKAVLIATSAGAGERKVFKMMRDSLFYWGVPYIKEYGLAVQARNWASVKAEKKEKIAKDLDKLAVKIKKVGKPKVGIKTRVIFKIMAGMHKSGWDSSPVEKQYWEEKGWLKKERPWK